METYHGHVRTPQDAIILFEACRLGVLPRVQRRLSEKERQQIRSGSVFVWDEREAGMRRWTDGKSWSASRVSGSFLTYREMEGKRGGSGFTPSQPVKKTSSGRSQDGSRSGEGEAEADSGEDGPEGYRYKQDGLMKQSFSITTNNNQHLHLISYYARLQPTASPLKQPSTDPALRHIRPAKGMYPESSVNEASNVPAVTRGPMPGSPYAAAPPQIAVAPPYAHAIPISFQPGYPPPGSWPGSPVGPQYYYAHAPPHLHSPLHYPYHHPYGPPPPQSVYDRPPHLPPPASGATYSSGYPPGSRPPLPSALPHTQPSLAPNPYSSESRPAHLPSPGPPSATNGHSASFPPFPSSNNKPLTPPPSGSTGVSDVRPQSHDPTTTKDPAQKVLPTIGALIHSDTKSSAPQTTGAADQRETNGTITDRAGSKSPAAPSGPAGPQLRDLPSDKGSCRQDMMAIAALDGRFNKPTT